METLGKDFPEKMSSLGEVQKLIGLSLSKIQHGRTQRGGLPLHKNLLVATVLSKARDIYMKETMYMNYKMMTGQQLGGHSQDPFGFMQRARLNEEKREAMEDEAEDELEEGEVDDECDQEMPGDASSNSSQLPYVSTMAAMMMQAAVAVRSSTPGSGFVSQQSFSETQEISKPEVSGPSDIQTHTVPSSIMVHNQRFPRDENAPHLDPRLAYQGEERFQDHYVQPQPEASSCQAQPEHSPPTPINTNDEGFIDCDCDARNFSTLESHVPFKYCFHCVTFQSANGRGPTLVPSPSSCPTSISPEQVREGESRFMSSQQMSTPKPGNSDNDFTIYDMDSKSTELCSPIDQVTVTTSRQASKRHRISSIEGQESTPVAKRSCLWSRRESVGEDIGEDTPIQEKVEQGETFHPAFRQETSSGQQSMEIDQITSLVSIFSFGQQMMVATGGTTPNAAVEQADRAHVTSAKSGNDDSDSESDTSSDSGHFGDDLETSQVDKSRAEDPDASLADNELSLTESEKSNSQMLCSNTASSKSDLVILQTSQDSSPMITVEQGSKPEHQPLDGQNPIFKPDAILNLEPGPDLNLEQGPDLNLEQGPDLNLEQGPNLNLVKSPEDEEDSDSDTSSDSGHSSDDLENTLELTVSPDSLSTTVIKSSQGVTPAPSMCPV